MSLEKFKECVDNGDVLGAILTLPTLPDLNIRYYDLYISTPLMYALDRGMYPIVETLLKMGSIPAKMSGDDVPPLHAAIGLMLKDINVIQILLDAGADIREVDNRGWTALHYAAKYENREVANMLVDLAPDLLYCRSTDNYTPADIAYMLSTIEMGQMLKELEEHIRKGSPNIMYR